MATKQEDIIVKLGGDSKALLKELNMTRQAANQWARETGKELTQGALPEAWKRYNGNVKEAFKEIEKGNKEASRSFTEVGKDILKIAVGKELFKKIAEGLREIVSAAKEVAEEFGKMDAALDSSAFLKQQREKELRGISNVDRDTIVAGGAQLQMGGNKLKDYAAKAGGLYAFGTSMVGNLVGNAVNSRDPFALLFGWSKAAQQAEASQQEIVQGIRAAANGVAAETAAKEAALAADKEQKQLRADQLKDLGQWLEKNRFERALVKYHLAEELAARKKITDQLQLQANLQARANGLVDSIAGNIMGEFMPGLDDLAQRGIYTKDARRAIFLGGDIKESLQFGRKKRAEGDMMELQSIRDRLSKAGVYNDPNKAMIDELKALTDPVKNGSGLPVQVTLKK